ncbi:MAG: hypothetical protein ACYTG0_25060 [Planctomycetota bacterium]|jgi:hypothetical protein
MSQQKNAARQPEASAATNPGVGNRCNASEKTITGTTRVSLGLLLSVLVLATAVAGQWADLASRFKGLEQTLELRFELIRKEIESRTRDRWTASQDAILMHRFAEENDLGMVRHPGDHQGRNVE